MNMPNSDVFPNPSPSSNVPQPTPPPANSPIPLPEGIPEALRSIQSTASPSNATSASAARQFSKAPVGTKSIEEVAARAKPTPTPLSRPSPPSITPSPVSEVELLAAVRREIEEKHVVAGINDEGELHMSMEGGLSVRKSLPLSEIDDKMLASLTPSQKDELLFNAITLPLPCLKSFLLNKLLPVCQKGNERESAKILFLRLASRPFDAEIVSDFKRLAQSGYCSIGVDTLKACMYAQNLPLIDFILSKSSPEWKAKNLEAILETFLETEDPNTEKFLLKYMPNIGLQCPTSLLEKAVVNGCVRFVEMMLTHGKTLSPVEETKLAIEACGKYNLPMIKLFCHEKGGIPLPLARQLESYTGPESYEKRCKILLSFALHSPMPEIYKLVQRYPEYTDALADVLEKLPLLVRLPRKYQHEARTNFQDLPTFISSSDEYARKNCAFIEEHPLDQNRDDFFEAIVSRRTKEHSLDPGYKKKVMDNSSYSSNTQFYRCDDGKKSQDVENLPNISIALGILKTSRYYPSLSHLSQMLYDPTLKNWRFPSHLSLLKSHKCNNVIIDSTYDLPTETVKLSKMEQGDFSSCWYHPLQAPVKKMQDELNKLHSEVFTYKLTSEEANRNMFFEKVARLYWLTATLCEMERGTPHNAMMYLNGIYAHHKLPGPIPKLEHFFLDNTMLMIPVETAIKDWKSYFEPTLDEALEAPSEEKRMETVRSLLKRTPRLFMHCSDKVRNDPACLAIFQQ